MNNRPLIYIGAVELQSAMPHYHGQTSPTNPVNAVNVGLESHDVGLEQNKAVILSLIQENPRATAKELATKLHITTRTEERIFQQLKLIGKIKREGGKRYGHWIILKS